MIFKILKFWFYIVFGWSIGLIFFIFGALLCATVLLMPAGLTLFSFGFKLLNPFSDFYQ